MGDSYLMGTNSNAWDSCLAQRRTPTCKRTKSNGSSISAHELSLVIQAFGNLNSVALSTFTHDSPSTTKALKVLSEDHSFCKRFRPLTQASLFINGSIPMRQARPGKIDCQPSREGSCLVRRPLRCGDERLSKRPQTRSRSRWREHGTGVATHPIKKAAGPCWELRPYQAHELSGACLTAGWRRPCRAPRSRRGGTAGWRRGREGSRGR